MNHRMSCVTVFSLFLFFALTAQAADTATTPQERLLFVYDTLDKGSLPCVQAIRDELAGAGFAVDEASAGALRRTDAKPYDRLVIYGMVMAFNWKSTVRDWLKTQNNLENRKIFIFVTANRWFKDNLHRDLVKLASQKKATVVDAVSMATNKVSDREKRLKIKTLLAAISH